MEYVTLLAPLMLVIALAVAVISKKLLAGQDFVKRESRKFLRD